MGDFGVATVLGATTLCFSSCYLQLGLQFPAAGAAGAMQHMIDLARHPEATLLLAGGGAGGNTHPLIIRLETITERGLQEGHTLEVPRPHLPLNPPKPTCRSETARL